MNTGAPDLDKVLSRILREDRGRLISALIAVLGDFELAEEALSDALESALIHWARSGLPASPNGWLLKVARRKAIDRLRRLKTQRDYAREISALAQAEEADMNRAVPDIPDERLRMIFMCCHPALDLKSRVALTLRSLGGLSTREIAAAFLDAETTMGQRLSRARKKISLAGIPFGSPDPDLWDQRLNAVLAVIYLIFNEGYSAHSGESSMRIDLCEEAIYLARMLDMLSRENAEVEGLLALMLITHARRGTRQGDAPCDHDMLTDGLALLDIAIARRSSGPYQIKAAISALHSKGGDPDWPQVFLLYERLYQFEPTSIIALNRAVALAETGALSQALQRFEHLADELQDYQPFHAAIAEYLGRDGQIQRARGAYLKAIDLAGNASDRAFFGSTIGAA